MTNPFRGLRSVVFGLLAILSLAGCAQSPFSGYTQAGRATAQAVETAAAQQRVLYSPVASAQIAVVQNPDINGGRLSAAAEMKIQQYNISCQKQVSPQLAGPVQSVVGGAVPYAAAGFVGTGVGAHAAFGTAASVATYGVYGGLAELGLGGINGALTGSYAMASAIGTCTRDFWDDVVHTNPLFAGAHVEVVYYGKRWFGSAPPALRGAVANNTPQAANDNVREDRVVRPSGVYRPTSLTSASGSPRYVRVPPASDLPNPNEVLHRAGIR